MIDPSQITLLRHPLITTKYFTIILFNFIVKVLKFLQKKWLAFTVLTILIVAPYLVKGPHQTILRSVEEIGYFSAYWIILGIASSIGLGTGLHTFVLYLGPWIAKVTMVANDC